MYFPLLKMYLECIQSVFSLLEMYFGFFPLGVLLGNKNVFSLLKMYLECIQSVFSLLEMYFGIQKVF